MQPGSLFSLEVEIQGQFFPIEALVDTGFDGYLILPEGSVRAFGSWDGDLFWILADGSAVKRPYVLGIARMPELQLEFAVMASEMGSEAIAGRSLTDQLKLTLDHGRELVVEP